jgi:hypothetical protein
MNSPYTKSEIADQLVRIQLGLTETIQSASDEQLSRGTTESWSAADYVKHLILSVKPFAKGLNLPPDQMRSMFGSPDRPSRDYDGVVAAYKARLAAGIRAEDYPAVTPVVYRMPEDAPSLREYLVETWNDSNDRLLSALNKWNEADLDVYQLPHPAVNLLTLREMLFFTIYHNTLHWNDARQAMS